MSGKFEAKRVVTLTRLRRWPTSLGVDPVAGCENPEVADARARVLVGGCKGGIGQEWDRVDRRLRSSAEIIRCYLLAAALDGLDTTSVLAWVCDPPDPTPMSLLE
ncbi:MAG: hypothetical protein ACRD0H_17260, partial [Actinomycetes bacterium]